MLLSKKLMIINFKFVSKMLKRSEKIFSITTTLWINFIQKSPNRRRRWILSSTKVKLVKFRIFWSFCVWHRVVHLILFLLNYILHICVGVSLPTWASPRPWFRRRSSGSTRKQSRMCRHESLQRSSSGSRRGYSMGTASKSTRGRLQEALGDSKMRKQKKTKGTARRR